MSRLSRLRRITAALDVQEHQARRSMAEANRELDAAGDAMRDVLDQCRRSGQDPARDATGPQSALSFAATRALVQAGLREATDRQRQRDEAAEVAEQLRLRWQEAHRRQDAIARLTDRWRLVEQVTADRRRDAELDDLINARAHRPSPAEPLTVPDMEAHR